MTVADQSPRGTADAHKNTHDVTIAVNNSPVILPAGKYTGLQIKEAAIAQGASDVRPDFVLSVQRGNHYDVIGDTDLIQIHPNLDFVAVTGDDNS
ncbi:MAG: multiubiquitin domain-containing protein [Candidatus Nanopelagicales bacterium]